MINQGRSRGDGHDAGSSTVICKNLVSAKVNKIELDIGLEGSDYAASIGAIRISVPFFKTEIFNSKNLASPSDSMLCQCTFLRFFSV